MRKRIFIHVGYMSSDGKSNHLTGHLFVELKEGNDANWLLNYLLAKIKEDNPEIDYHVPTITSITEISPELWFQLFPEQK